ncbi:hypothetical protein [Vibrio mediterranei]|uniref:hypothetical protein n=1 Tax=Vibrio mediterranei TaxID=689 RepID=UPI00406925B9
MDAVSTYEHRESQPVCQSVQAMPTFNVSRLVDEVAIAQKALTRIREDLPQIPTDVKISAFHFTKDYLNEVLLLANSLGIDELDNVLCQPIHSACIQSLLDSISGRLEERFEERREGLKKRSIERFMSKITTAFDHIDEKRLRELIEICCSWDLLCFDLSFNNGRTDMHDPNFEGMALTLSADSWHLHEINAERLPENINIRHAIDELAMKANQAPTLGFLGYIVDVEGLEEHFDFSKIHTSQDIYKQKTAMARFAELYDFEDDDEAAICRVEEVIMYLAERHHFSKKPHALAKIITDLTEDTSSADTFVHVCPAHSVIDDGALMGWISNELYGAEREECEFSVRLPPSEAESLLDKFYLNTLLLSHVDALTQYNTPMDSLYASVRERLSDTSYDTLPIR